MSRRYSVICPTPKHLQGNIEATGDASRTITRPAVHTSINILTASSPFRVACVSYQYCASAIALPYLAICCCLSICCYVVRGYVTPSCILHSISCSITHDNPHDACPSVPYLHCTHAHACMHCIRCVAHPSYSVLRSQHETPKYHR